MTKKERVDIVINTLEQLYPEVPIPLNHTDTYTLLMAVLPTAQCNDMRVNLITPLLFAIADKQYDMVKLGLAKIAEIIRLCRIRSMKSKWIYWLSQILSDKYNGEVPNDIEALEEL